MSEARIIRLVGALAEARPLRDVGLYEVVRIGRRRLVGEVIRIAADTATLQVYEETAGLALGEPVEPTGGSLSAELGPGLLGSVLDGIGRPLALLAAEHGPFLTAGAVAPTLDRKRRWRFRPERRAGERLEPGDVLGVLEDVPGPEHRVLVPPGVAGELRSLDAGEYAVEDAIGMLEGDVPLTLMQRWPVRTPRPAATPLPPDRPFLTGQRIFDLLFPVAEGGSVAVPGGFGTGKTVIEQSLAKFGDADIVVYVGCGERGNEMAEALGDFAELIDPRSGRPVMERAVLVVNTSNMPVAARETSVYLGLTIAEFYRDMGHRVAVMTDSLSRWAEALREIGSRLQEMPGEEGYPTTLPNRLAHLYERAGRVRCLGSPERVGAVTLVSAVSPPGGDFSEPVTQASLRVSGALWALDPSLAHQRQFPAVDWSSSYSVFAEATAPWFAAQVDPEWPATRRALLELLQRDAELREIAGLAGPEALEDVDRLVLEAARIVREAVIGQSAFDPQDAFSPPDKTFALAWLARALYEQGQRALASGRSWSELDLEAARRAIAAVRDAEPEAREARVAAARACIEALAPPGPDGEYAS